jgi:hypothetical protein
MHAYLIYSKSQQEIKDSINKIVKEKKAILLEFTIQKIADVRSLQEFTKLTLSSPTVIFIGNIEGATPEALNAFLKNLEEPQENLTYILSTRNMGKILPTISSRCQIIKGVKRETILDKNLEAENFLELSPGSRLFLTSQIKGREEATAFLEKTYPKIPPGITYQSQLPQKPGQNINSCRQNSAIYSCQRKCPNTAYQYGSMLG